MVSPIVSEDHMSEKPRVAKRRFSNSIVNHSRAAVSLDVGDRREVVDDDEDAAKHRGSRRSCRCIRGIPVDRRV